MKTQNTSLLRFSLICLILCLGGCAAVKSVLGIKPHTALTQIRIQALAGANLDNGTALDLVFVYDSQLLPQLPKTGPLWFATKADLMANHPLTLDVARVRIAPTKFTDITLNASRRKAVAVYTYANFLAPGGQAMGDLTLFSCAQITLSPSAVIYQSCN